MILYLAILIQYRHVTDGDTHDDSIYCASRALRGNKSEQLLQYAYADMLLVLRFTFILNIL